MKSMHVDDSIVASANANFGLGSATVLGIGENHGSRNLYFTSTAESRGDLNYVGSLKATIERTGMISRYQKHGLVPEGIPSG